MQFFYPSVETDGKNETTKNQNHKIISFIINKVIRLISLFIQLLLWFEI